MPGSRRSYLILFAILLSPFSLFSQSLSEASRSTLPAKSPIVYINRQYGFRCDLPASWKGYTVLTQQWEGTTQDIKKPRKEHGPRIILRHPLWTAGHPRQDIPIMIFTIHQWNEDLIVSAAPIGPSELGRNSRYVFALPPRYNYAFPDGFEEVEDIIKNKPLHPFNPQATQSK